MAGDQEKRTSGERDVFLDKKEREEKKDNFWKQGFEEHTQVLDLKGPRVTTWGPTYRVCCVDEVFTCMEILL